MNFRKAGLADIEELCKLRKQQLKDEGEYSKLNIDQGLYEFFYTKMIDETLIQWVVEANGLIVATGALLIMDFPPNFFNYSGKRGYITNMYTLDEYRGRGLAGAILERLLESAKAAKLTKLMLCASKMGKPVYRKFGFKELDTWMDMEVK